MFRVSVPPTLLVGYDESVINILNDIMGSMPVMGDQVLGLKYKPKPEDALNLKIMSPFPKIPRPHILDILDPFNAKNIAKEFSVVIIDSKDEISVRTGKILRDLGLEVYVYMNGESVEIDELDIDYPDEERVPRYINGLYVIPGHGKKVLDKTAEKIGDGYITETGCIVAPTLEEALRIMNERSI